MSLLVALAPEWRHQHALDLEVYQSSHQDWKNHWLHALLIPVEHLAAVVFVTGLLYCLIVGLSRSRQPLLLPALFLHLIVIGGIGFGMGMICLVIAPPHHPCTGMASFVYMVVSSVMACRLVTSPECHTGLVMTHWNNYYNKAPNNNQHYLQHYTQRILPCWRILLVAMAVWMLSSSLQVVVGHWIWEGNSPDVLNSDSHVSWLALTHSVQIAWSG